MRITVQCEYCMVDYITDNYWEVSSYVSQCAWCNVDKCENCESESTPRMHQECYDSSIEDDEE